MARLTQEERMRLYEKGEIDLYDAIEPDLPDNWSFRSKSDESEQQWEIRKNHHRPNQEPTRFRVLIRTQNKTTFELATIPVRSDMDIESHEAEIFDHFFKKLNGRFIHIRKPIHRALRTSIVEELRVDRLK